MQLTPIIEGAADGPTLFFIQGWPDDHSIWDAQVEVLRTRYRCVRVNLPNYDGAPQARWGFDTDTIVEALASTIREVSPNVGVTLVIHDWGAYWGYILHHRHPELVTRVAGLDIGPHIKPRGLDALGMLAYQSFLACAFVIGGRVGDLMTRSLAKALDAPAAKDGVSSRVNYPYRNMMRELVSGRASKLTRGYWPRVPLFFAYGKRNPLKFHSERWLDHVRNTGGEVLALDSDHWVQRDPLLTEALAAFLARTDARAKAA